MMQTARYYDHDSHGYIDVEVVWNGGPLTDGEGWRQREAPLRSDGYGRHELPGWRETRNKGGADMGWRENQGAPTPNRHPPQLKRRCQGCGAWLTESECRHRCANCYACREKVSGRAVAR